jgi:hypothetical protein
MPTLQETIFTKFLKKVAEQNKLDEEKLNQLRNLLSRTQKPKAEELVKIFSAPGDIK